MSQPTPPDTTTTTTTSDTRSGGHAIEPSGPSRLLLVLGVAAVVLGLAGGIVLFVVGQQRASSTVERLARAPVGCDTTLEFSGTGTFVVFVETQGRIEQLDGGCDAPTTYDRRRAAEPDVSIELTGPSGGEIAVRPTDAEAYDTDGFAGRPTGEISIDDAGRHLVRVTSEDDDFAVSIGRDPAGVATPFTVSAVMVALAGLVGGLTLIAIAVARGRRGADADPPAADAPPPFVPGGVAPTEVPLAPPPPGSVVAPPPTPWAPPPPGEQPSEGPTSSPS